MRTLGSTYAQETVIVGGSTYLGGETVTPAGASAEATVPAGTTTAILAAEGGAAYYAINAASADADAPGYVPEDGYRPIVGVANLTSLHLFAADGVKVHLEYYQD